MVSDPWSGLVLPLQVGAVLCLEVVVVAIIM